MRIAACGRHRTGSPYCATDSAQTHCTEGRRSLTLHTSTSLRADDPLHCAQTIADAAQAHCGPQGTLHVRTAVRLGYCRPAPRYSVNLQDAHMLGSSHTLNPSDRPRCILPMDTLQTL